MNRSIRTNTLSNHSDHSDTQDSLHIGHAIGILVGACTLLILVVVIIINIYKHRKDLEEEDIRMRLNMELERSPQEPFMTGNLNLIWS